MNARGLGRLGMLAVGLGMGAAVAAVGCPPGIASADTSTDWLSSIDGLLTGGSPAASSPLDYQISFNGQDLFPTMGNEATATTVAGQYGLAIAYGDGAKAIAEGGTGDYALASGTNAFAGAGSLTGTGNNYDTAVDIGNNADPDTLTGAPDGAYAGGASLVGNGDSGTNSHDTAIDIGNNGTGSEFPSGGQSGAFAGDSNLLSFTGGPATVTPHTPTAASTASAMARSQAGATTTTPACPAARPATSTLRSQPSATTTPRSPTPTTPPMPEAFTPATATATTPTSTDPTTAPRRLAARASRTVTMTSPTSLIRSAAPRARPTVPSPAPS
jgi:hypothetical protein